MTEKGSTRRMTLGELRNRAVMSGDPAWRTRLEEVLEARRGKSWDSDEWVELPECRHNERGGDR